MFNRLPFQNVLNRKNMLSALMGMLCWGSVSAPAQAWWETGHMTVAQLAYDELTPAARAEAERLIAVLDPMQPDVNRRHFVPASIWMDEIKGRGLRTFDEWHYINIPYNPEGLGVVEDAKEVNVVSMIEKLTKTLHSDKAGDFEKAFALRMLIHMVGDVHQPFHAVGKVSHAYPHGDWGGNRTLVKSPGVKNIHALWDSTAGLFENNIAMNEWQVRIPPYVQTLKTTYPKAQFQHILSDTPQQWAEESFKLAVKYGYSTLPEDGQVTELYRQGVQRVVGERLALGGYRLGALLNAALQ